jgi:hypothetical protein
MSLTTTQLAALTNEINTDPRAYGYSSLKATGNDQGLADALNLARDGTNIGPVISVNRGSISTQELVEAVVRSEMPASQADRDWLIMVSSGVRVRVDTGSTARAGLLGIFGVATTTRTNLTNVASKSPASRAEELFGVNVVVTPTDVAASLGRG